MNGYVDKNDGIRIINDARIAIDALESIAMCDKGGIHTKYLKEKASMAKRCIDFMLTFCEEDD